MGDPPPASNVGMYDATHQEPHGSESTLQRIEVPPDSGTRPADDAPSAPHYVTGLRERHLAFVRDATSASSLRASSILVIAAMFSIRQSATNRSDPVA